MYRRGADLLSLVVVYAAIAAAVAEQEPAMSLAEQDALFTVMDAMAGNGQRWRQSHPQPCVADMWEGLECEQRTEDPGLLHVTALGFGSKPFPSCAHNATLPFAITKLEWLASLRISACFTNTGSGGGSPATIPSFLRLLPSLLELSIRSNTALSGSIPPDLASISTLQILSLSQNALSGSIPPSLAQLRSLQRLDLSENRLTGAIPAELGVAASLVILDLSGNSLTGPIPTTLANLTHLQKLDLSLNSLSGGVPAELATLPALQFLALDHNRLRGPIPPPLMGGAAGLQYLILDSNPINASIPPFVGGGVGSLVVFSCSECGLVGEIPPSTAELTNLTVLSLEGNGLTGQIPPGLAELSHIYQLNLSNNSLSGAVPFKPEFVKKLGRGIDLSGNVGLCTHWAEGAAPPFDSGLSGVAACSDPKYTALVTSAASSLPSLPLLLSFIFNAANQALAGLYPS